MKNCNIIILTVLLFTEIFAQKTVPANDEIIANRLISKAIAILLDTVEKGEALTINSPQNNPISVWATQILMDSCLSRNYLVYSTPKNGKEIQFHVEISDIHSKINYRSAGKRLLIFKKTLNRTFQGSYQLQIRNREGQIIFSQKITGYSQDIIPFGALKQVEKDNYPFTKGTKLSSPFIKRWLEPAIITTTTMTVVYLFYSLRSES